MKGSSEVGKASAGENGCSSVSCAPALLGHADRKQCLLCLPWTFQVCSCNIPCYLCAGPALWIRKHVLCPSEQRHRAPVLAELVSGKWKAAGGASSRFGVVGCQN